MYVLCLVRATGDCQRSKDHSFGIKTFLSSVSKRVPKTGEYLVYVMCRTDTTNELLLENFEDFDQEKNQCVCDT